MTFTRQVSKWSQTGLRDFPWRRRGGLGSYAILTTEMLLTRTKAETVAQVLPEVLTKFPEPEQMASAPQELIEQTIQPLGLQTKRAHHLKATAAALLEKHEGKVPRSEEKLLELPGVGQYAADATLSVAFRVRRPILDANVARLLHRWFGLRPPADRLSSDLDYRTLASSLLPKRKFLEYNWGLLDLATAHCKPRRPLCDGCPLTAGCTKGQSITL